jgi:hypothetical protein
MKEAVESSYKEPKSVTIEKASNGGYVITTYNDSGRTLEVAKDKEEMAKVVARILEG